MGGEDNPIQHEKTCESTPWVKEFYYGNNFKISRFKVLLAFRISRLAEEKSFLYVSFAKAGLSPSDPHGGKLLCGNDK
ncbi:MAG: hypothetical protein Kow0042_29600 [Calditrichia bacterium]